MHLHSAGKPRCIGWDTGEELGEEGLFETNFLCDNS